MVYELTWMTQRYVLGGKRDQAMQIHGEARSVPCFQQKSVIYINCVSFGQMVSKVYVEMGFEISQQKAGAPTPLTMQRPKITCTVRDRDQSRSPDSKQYLVFSSWNFKHMKTKILFDRTKGSAQQFQTLKCSIKDFRNQNNNYSGEYIHQSSKTTMQSVPKEYSFKSCEKQTTFQIH